MRTGKLPAAIGPATPRLRAAMFGPWSPPVNIDWTQRVGAWPMLANDTLGDCVPAAALHLVQCWRANAWGSLWQPANAEALALYARWAGYDGTPARDHGTVMATAMAQWGRAGITVGGSESVPWAAHIDPVDVLGLKAAIAELGGALGGLLLPTAALSASGAWDVPNGGVNSPGGARGGAGGHCVALVGYDAAGLLCVTWGTLRRMSWAFWLTYADEAWAVCSRGDWLGANGVSPSRLDWDRLELEVEKIACA